MNFKKKENKLPPYKAPARTIKNKISSPSIDCQTKMPRYRSVIDCENAYNFQTLLQYVIEHFYLVVIYVLIIPILIVLL